MCSCFCDYSVSLELIAKVSSVDGGDRHGHRRHNGDCVHTLGQWQLKRPTFFRIINMINSQEWLPLNAIAWEWHQTTFEACNAIKTSKPFEKNIARSRQQWHLRIICIYIYDGKEH